jgi:tripartite-type tricarboxylate transporter receptor subunit TctC
MLSSTDKRSTSRHSICWACRIKGETGMIIGKLLAVLAVGIGLVVGEGVRPAAAQGTYPDKPIKIIVPFGAGGPADLYARLMGTQLQEVLKQPVIIINKPGAGAIIGTTEAAQSPPDGYTLLMMSNTHTANETLFVKKPYKLLNDFVPVSPVNASDLVIVTHPSVGATTLTDFIALAKSKPGNLTYASSGPGTPYHLAGENFKSLSGTDIVHVPHKGSGEARSNVLGGHVMMMMDAVTTMSPMITNGQVRALATTGPMRSTVLPNVPTAAEAGLPGFEATIWLGFMAPKGTPPAIVDRLNTEMAKIQARPEIKDGWAKQGAVPLVMSPAQFGAYIQADVAKWAKVIETAKIVLDN